MSFAPSGITDDTDIRTASSIIDYIFRRLGKSYMSFDDQLELGLASIDDMPEAQTSLLDEEQAVEATVSQPAVVEVPVAPTLSQELQKPIATPSSTASKQADSAPMCFNCGNQTQKAGSCYVCTSCGSTTGCS